MSPLFSCLLSFVPFLSSLSSLWLGAQEAEVALASSRDAVTKAELARQHAEDEVTTLRDQLQNHLNTMREDSLARDAAANLELGELREASANQTVALQQALEEGSRLKDACTAAEAAVTEKEAARCKAVEDLSVAEERLANALEDLKLAQEEASSLQAGLAEARALCETSQEEGRREAQARLDAESSARQHSERSVELERLLAETQTRSCEVESELGKSREQVEGLAQDLGMSREEVEGLAQQVGGYREEVAAAAAKLGEVEESAARQEATLRASLDRGAELEDALGAARSQLEGEHTPADRRRGLRHCARQT